MLVPWRPFFWNDAEVVFLFFGPRYLNIKRDRASNRRSCDEGRSALAGYRAPWG